MPENLQEGRLLMTRFRPSLFDLINRGGITAGIRNTFVRRQSLPVKKQHLFAFGSCLVRDHSPPTGLEQFRHWFRSPSDGSEKRFPLQAGQPRIAEIRCGLLDVSEAAAALFLQGPYQ